MRKWWRPRPEEGQQPPISPSPSPEPDVTLPDPAEAREALERSREVKKRTDQLNQAVREMLNEMRAAREENHFTQGIVEMIKKGR